MIRHSVERSGKSFTKCLLYSAAGAFAIFLRPVEISILFSIFGGVSLLWGQKQLFWYCLSIGVGGWLVWCMESFLFFEGVGDRFLEAFAHVSEGESVTYQFVNHFVALGVGKRHGVPHLSGLFPYLGILYWTVSISILISGLLCSVKRNSSFFLVLASLLAGVTLLLVFSFKVVNIVAPRFLLPAYAAWAIGICIALNELANSLKEAPRKNVFLVSVFSIFLIAFMSYWSFVTVSKVDSIEREREVSVKIAAALEGAIQGDCVFVSQYAGPQISYYSGCNVLDRKVSFNARVSPDIFKSSKSQTKAVIVWPSATVDAEIAKKWRLLEVEGAKIYFRSEL